MGKKDKSLDELEDELARIEAELAALERGEMPAGAPAPTAKPKKSPKLKTPKAKAEAPAPEAPPAEAGPEAPKAEKGGLAAKVNLPFGKGKAKDEAPTPEADDAPKKRFGLPGKMKLPFGKAKPDQEPAEIPAPAPAEQEAPAAPAPTPAPAPARETPASAAAPDSGFSPRRGPVVIPVRAARTTPLPLLPPVRAGAWVQEGRVWRHRGEGTPEVLRRELDADGSVLREEPASPADLVGVPRVLVAPEPGGGSGYTPAWARSAPEESPGGEPDGKKPFSIPITFNMPFGRKRDAPEPGAPAQGEGAKPSAKRFSFQMPRRKDRPEGPEAEADPANGHGAPGNGKGAALKDRLKSFARKGKRDDGEPPAQ